LHAQGGADRADKLYIFQGDDGGFFRQGSLGRPATRFTDNLNGDDQGQSDES